MKISSLSTPGTPGTNLASTNVGQTADPGKLERARAVARGEAPADLNQDPQSNRIQDVRRIRMNTQRSVDRDLVAIQEAAAAPAEESSTSDTTEAGTVEATQPLSPQLAALAKEKRALAVRAKELEAREKAISERPQDGGTESLIARIKSQPLSVLQEHGVTYDQLTEHILSGTDGINPEIQALKEEIKALKAGVDKTLTDRDSQQENAALAEMSREATRLASSEEFELVRETGSIPKVIELIKRTYEASGKTEVMDVSEAMRLIEDELLEDNLRIAKLNKVQGKLAPPAAPTLQPQQRQMRTLTSAGSSTAPMTARQRALAAFSGQLKR